MINEFVHRGVTQFGERVSAAALPFRKIEFLGRLLQNDRAAYNAKLDLRFRSQPELIANVFWESSPGHVHQSPYLKA